MNPFWCILIFSDIFWFILIQYSSPKTQVEFRIILREVGSTRYGIQFADLLINIFRKAQETCPSTKVHSDHVFVLELALFDNYRNPLLNLAPMTIILNNELQKLLLHKAPSQFAKMHEITENGSFYARIFLLCFK